MNIKSLRWQDIYKFFPAISRNEFTYNYDKQQILQELSQYLNHSIFTDQIDLLINSLSQSTNLEKTKEEISHQFHGLNIHSLPSVRKIYEPDVESDNFKKIVIEKAIKPFFTQIIQNLDFNLLDIVCHATYNSFQEAYKLDKTRWENYNPHITSIILSRIMPSIISQLSRHGNDYLFSYASHLRDNFSYWRENQYLYEKSNNLPISDPQNGLCYKMFGTTNKDTRFTLEQINGLFSVVGEDLMTEEEYAKGTLRQENEIKQIEQERNQYLKKVV